MPSTQLCRIVCHKPRKMISAEKLVIYLSLRDLYLSEPLDVQADRILALGLTCSLISLQRELCMPHSTIHRYALGGAFVVWWLVNSLLLLPFSLHRCQSEAMVAFEHPLSLQVTLAVLGSQVFERCLPQSFDVFQLLATPCFYQLVSN